MAHRQPRYSPINTKGNINLELNTLSSKWEKMLRKLKIYTLSPLPRHYCTFHSKKNLLPFQQNNTTKSLFPLCAKQ